MEAVLLKQPYEVSFTGNPIPFSFAITPYRDNEKLQDIRLQVRIHIEDFFNSGSFTEVRSQQFYPDANGQVEFDVQSIVDPYLEYYVPKLTLLSPVQAVNQRKRYKVSYLLTKDQTIVGTLNETAVLHVIKGGLAYEAWHPKEFFSSLVTVNKKPLHFFTAKEKVAADERRFFWWTYPHSNSAVQSIRFTITLNTGTQIVFLVDADGSYIIDADGSRIIVSGGSNQLLQYDLPGTVPGGKWAVFCVPSGFNQTGLNTLVPSGSYAIQYTMGIYAGATEIVAPVTFFLDYRNFYDTHDLLYRNSVGGLDTIRLRGQVDFEADYIRQQAQRTVPPSYYRDMVLMPHTSQQNEEATKYKGDTGFISKQAADKLRDLFLSEEVYEITSIRLLPLVINTKNAKFFSNKENLVSTQIEWQRAFANDKYTPAGLMPQVRSCPAVETFVAKQINKNKIQIMYALATPYDALEVQVIVGADTFTYLYNGNARSVIQQFANPSSLSQITVKARTVCDEESSDYGPYTTVVLAVVGNSLPIVNDDTFSILSGFNTPVMLQGSVLDNDVDPDGDVLEVVQASGATNKGGLYQISSAGIVSYQPPTPLFSGNDWFNYNARELGGSTTVIGRVNINVGNAITTVYVKLVKKVTSHIDAAAYKNTIGELWLEFYANPSGTDPLDVTALALAVNTQQIKKSKFGFFPEQVQTTNVAINPTGVKVKLFEGELYYYYKAPQEQPTVRSFEINLLTGTGYTII